MSAIQGRWAPFQIMQVVHTVNLIEQRGWNVTIADSVSPIARARGPAIQMDAADHALTASYGNSARAQAYREEIGSLVEQGRCRDAMAREIRDVRSIVGSKYNEAIRAMLDYAKSSGYLTNRGSYGC